MGQLLELCESDSRMYWPLMSPSAPRTAWVLDRLAEISIELADLEQLLKRGWRDQVVAGVASLFHADPMACLPLLWQAFDSGSWASPQLGICAMLLEPNDPSQACRRLLLRCPVHSRHLEGTDPMWRHVVHGNAAIDSHSTKAMAALLETLARSPEGRDWLTGHLPFEEAYWALEVDFWDRGEKISRRWSNGVGPILAGLGKPVPAWLLNDSPDDLLGMWDLKAQPPAVRCLSRGEWNTRIERFFLPFARAGHTSLLLEGDEHRLRLSSRTPRGNELLLELSGPYYDAIWRRLEFDTRSQNVFWLPNQTQELAALRIEYLPQGLSIYCLPEYQTPSDFELSERSLEDCPAQLWVIGIDERARFDGGAAAVAAAWGGEDLVDSVRYKMAQGERGPGVMVLATSSQLKHRGVSEVACLVTSPRPTLNQLCAGLESALNRARGRYSRVALPALGCGAAGFQAKEVAGPILAILARYRESFRITLCLPRESDRNAFEAAFRSQAGSW